MRRGRESGSGRAGRRHRRLGRVVVLLLLLAASACTSGNADRSTDPAYLCPRLLERCRECRQRTPGFSEWDCQGSDGTILERCKGKAAAREQWLEKLQAALALDSCREFEEAL